MAQQHSSRTVIQRSSSTGIQNSSFAHQIPTTKTFKEHFLKLILDHIISIKASKKHRSYMAFNFLFFCSSFSLKEETEPSELTLGHLLFRTNLVSGILTLVVETNYPYKLDYKVVLIYFLFHLDIFI